MDQKITHILGHNADVTAMSPDELLNNALSAQTLPRETTVLASLLSKSELCLQFVGGDRSKNGKMQQTTAEQVLSAASNESFKVEPLPGLNALRLRFDDDYMYGIHLPKDSPIDFPSVMAAFELESLKNSVIQIENTRRMGFQQEGEDLAFLDRPLEHKGLVMVLSRCDVTRAIFANDDIRFVPSSLDELLPFAQKRLYQVTNDPHSGRFNIKIGSTIYPCTLRDETDLPLWNAMFEALKSESELNHSYVRLMDPEVERLRERMKQAAFEIPGLQNDEPSPPPSPNDTGTTIVVPFRRR